LPRLTCLALDNPRPAYPYLPFSHEVLKVLSIGYMVYLAGKIAASRPRASSVAGKPLGALQAALFQWVNPKAWAMALTVLTVYTPTPGSAMVVLVALICGLVNTPSVFIWVVLGSQLRRLLCSETRLRIFNFGMALLLLATLYPVVSG
jgi:threonine/homoserine/homoserine lactone efflux protein